MDNLLLVMFALFALETTIAAACHVSPGLNMRVLWRVEGVLIASLVLMVVVSSLEIGYSCFHNTKLVQATK